MSNRVMGKVLYSQLAVLNNFRNVKEGDDGFLTFSIEKKFMGHRYYTVMHGNGWYNHSVKMQAGEMFMHLKKLISHHRNEYII